MRGRYRRKERKRQKQIMVFLVLGMFCFFSVGYATFGSSFLISGKGTIIEKPITVEDLKTKVVTSGDGLYKDPVEENRYVYRGASPNNYITFSGTELYRIIAIEEDNTVKVIIRSEIGMNLYDSGYADSISGITTANSLVGTRYSSASADYCYFNSETEYYGCNAWGSITTMLDSNENNVTEMIKFTVDNTTYTLPAEEAYINTYLNTTWFNKLKPKMTSKIENHIFNVGHIKNSSSQTLKTDIEQESSYKWKGKIGLINPTDYVKASTNENCTSVYQYKNNSSCYSESENHNYLSYGSHWSTINPYIGSATYHQGWIVENNGILQNYSSVNRERATRPVFFLSSDILLTGKGTKENPYMVVS